MALIVCKNCSKKVSDTVTNCIHCGSPLHEKEVVTIDANHAKTARTESQTIQAKSDLKKFSSLSNSKQIEYEKEFLDSNKKAYNFRRKELEFGKISSVGNAIFFIGIIIVLACRYLAGKFFNGTIFNVSLAYTGAICVIFMIVLGLVVIIANFIRKFFYKKSVKRFVYLKMFQKWLEENKQLVYYPAFSDKKEKAMFEEVDLTELDL